MIAEHVLERASALRATFQQAQPFKHLCIDDFCTADAAEALLHEFPAFDRERARNEFGDYGRKSAQPRLAAISPYYARVHEYLLSREFLDAMEAITGIPDLIADPSMFGGGTHENLDGQELDPHIDFNYMENEDAHRRVNLLVYLNKGWQEDWGGQIELHSNPRDPDRNIIEAFNVGFNRAVLFETNEVSWHGFPRIRLPPSQADNSRKCLSVYLYTKTRPEHEIAGKHGTFYVQRPLGAQFAAGHTLTGDDVAALHRAVRGRDMWIEKYQKMEERLARTIDERTTRMLGLEAQLEDTLATGGVPVVGFALMHRVTEGTRYTDGWATPELTIALQAVRPLGHIEVAFQVIEQMPKLPRTFTLEVDERRAEFTTDGDGPGTIALPVAIEAGTDFTIRLTCSERFRPFDLGLGADGRELAYMLRHISVE